MAARGSAFFLAFALLACGRLSREPEMAPADADASDDHAVDLDAPVEDAQDQDATPGDSDTGDSAPGDSDTDDAAPGDSDTDDAAPGDSSDTQDSAPGCDEAQNPARDACNEPDMDCGPEEQCAPSPDGLCIPSSCICVPSDAGDLPSWSCTDDCSWICVFCPRCD